MTETPSTKSGAERRRLDAVAVTATMLLGLLLGAVAWLLITPDSASDDDSATPVVTLSLPAPPPQASAVPEPLAESETQPEPPVAAEITPPAPPPAAVVALPPPALPSLTPAAPLPEPRAAADSAPPPATPRPPAPVTAPTPAPSESPPGPAATPPASPQITDIPEPPVYQTPPRGAPAPAPDGLAPAPDLSLVEQTHDGPLPVVGKDGRQPWQVYARPFDLNDKRPRIALIISGLGQSTAATEAAIQRLPGAVTLAFAPYAKKLDEWIGLARAAGHEVLLTVPMEPLGYPENDPGPHTLLTSLTERDNRERLLFLLSRFTGYVGVLNTMGARLTTAPQSLKPILEEIKERGLIFVDARSSMRSIAASQATEIGLPRAINNRFIDIKASRLEIDQRLEELERIAKEGGYALGIGSPYPVTIERVVLWVQELESKGIALAPVSALVDKQPD